MSRYKLNIGTMMKDEVINLALKKANVTLTRLSNPLKSTINPDILKIMKAAITDVEKDTRISPDDWPVRYDFINDVFNLGVASMGSLEKEKAFFEETLTHRQAVHFKSNDCYRLLCDGEKNLRKKLAYEDPEHRKVATIFLLSILSASFLLSLLDSNPGWLSFAGVFSYDCLAARHNESPSSIDNQVYLLKPETRKSLANIYSFFAKNVTDNGSIVDGNQHLQLSGAGSK